MAKKFRKKDIVADSVLAINIGRYSATDRSQFINLGLSFGFLLVVWAAATFWTTGVPGAPFIISAAVIGGYMAMNIGANDVANNIGPAVGSKALTLFGALVIAGVMEAAGAMLAGGDVVNTISKGIINPDNFASVDMFIWAMMSALLAAALWINLATWLGAPVSTTHSIVGGVLGAGVAAAGVAIVDWDTMGGIAASWIISPALGGIFAALFLAFIKKMILYQDDKIAAAKRWVPVLVAIMAGAFGMYLSIKGLKRIWTPDLITVWSVSLAACLITYFAAKPLIARRASTIENSKKSVNQLFTIPLIASAALLSFAHGANDVANAVGPLAAIVSAVGDGGIAAKVAIPWWVMLIGAVGISVGLFLFGAKLIRTVGGEITRLNQTRAFCVALSASITVIAASWMGQPVSSTHIAVGGVFGVGFLREYLANRAGKERYITDLSKVEMKDLPKKERKKIKKWRKRRLVRRRQLLTIIAAWLITVPVSAVLAGSIFLVLTRTLGSQ